MKVKMTATIVVKWVANSKDYETSNLAEMVKIDSEAALEEILNFGDEPPSLRIEASE